MVFSMSLSDIGRSVIVQSFIVSTAQYIQIISSFHLLNMWCEISEKGYHLCFRIPLICRKYVHAKIIFKPNLRVMAHLISLFQNVLKSKYSGLAEAEIVYKNIA